MTITDVGYLLQVTTGSWEGRLEQFIHEKSIEMLERDWTYFFACDSRNVRNQSPELKSGRRAATEILGDDASCLLVKQYPAELYSVICYS